MFLYARLPADLHLAARAEAHRHGSQKFKARRFPPGAEVLDCPKSDPAGRPEIEVQQGFDLLRVFNRLGPNGIHGNDDSSRLQGLSGTRYEVAAGTLLKVMKDTHDQHRVEGLLWKSESKEVGLLELDAIPWCFRNPW